MELRDALAGGAPTTPRPGGGEGLPVWVLRVRLEPVAGSPAVAGRDAGDPSRAGAWRAELLARVEAATRKAREGTPP
jgi:hypothetical protein